MSAAIAIFVKTPGLSPVKTRLAATIGEEKAKEFYLLSLKAVEKTVKTVFSPPLPSSKASPPHAGGIEGGELLGCW